MNHRIFVIFDAKARAYLPPFFLPEAGQATRAFSDMVNNPEHQFGLHPEDYTLFEIGTFDDRDCKLLQLKSFITHGVGLAFLAPDVSARPKLDLVIQEDGK